MPYITPVPITHSSVAGNVPDAAGELAIGALAVNVADGALYTKNYSGDIVRIEGDGGNDTLASAATLDLGAVMAGVVDVTGTTAITSISLRVGQTRTVRFTGALTLTHGANLVLPGAANITAAAGDFATFRGYAGEVVRCTNYSFSAAPFAGSLSQDFSAKNLTAAGVVDVRGIYIVTGTNVAFPGSGGNIQHRDDTGVVRWSAGLLGWAGATTYSIYDAVAGVTRFEINSSGAMRAFGAFGCNAKAAQTPYALGAAATDLATVIALANNLRTMAINNGMGS